MFFIPILSAILFLLCSLLLCSLFFLSSFSGRYYRPLFPSPPFAARPLHPPRLADRAAPPFFSSLPSSSVHFSRIIARTDRALWGFSLSLASGSDPDIFWGAFWAILDKYKKNIVFQAPKFAYIIFLYYLCTEFQDNLSSTNPLIH